jgi:hypothetical protein
MKRPCVIVFLQAGCPACSEFHPRFTRASAALRRRGLRVHAVDLGAPGVARAADYFGVRATPTTIGLGRHGNWKLEGAVGDAEIRSLLAAVVR